MTVESGDAIFLVSGDLLACPCGRLVSVVEGAFECSKCGATYWATLGWQEYRKRFDKDGNDVRSLADTSDVACGV